MTLPIESAFREALVDPGRPVPAGLLSPRGDSDPARFAVYRNNVHVSLVEALRARFPVCGQLVGEAFFTAMARLYVADHKPTSPIMLHYGDDFAGFVSTFDAARPVPYLADVTRLEIAWSHAYNAAEAPALDATLLGQLPADRLLASPLVVHPATQLVTSPYPVGSIWSAHQSSPPAPLAHQGAETVLVTRPQADVTVTLIGRADGAFVQALQHGQTIAEATSQALIIDQQFALGPALVGLVGLGAFTAIAEPSEARS